MIILYILLILCGSIFYRLGGIGGNWWQNTRVRDIGTNICALTIFTLHHHLISYLYILTFLLQWLALSGYWKFGKPDMRWYNWVFVAIGYSISAIPLYWCGASLIGLIVRSLILIITIPLVCEWSDNVWVEEGYRGLAFSASMLFL